MAAGFKDFSAGAVLAAADLEDYCELQGIMRFASAAARTTALSGVLTEGLFCYLIDLNVVQVYSGSDWSTVGPVHGALTSWTPAIVQSGAVTCTVTNARYQRIGRWVQGWFDLAVTGTGSGSNVVTVSLPVTAATNTSITIGTGSLTDASSTFIYPALLALPTTTTLDFRSSANSIAEPRLGLGVFTAGLASGDVLKGSFGYEAAADA